MKKSILSLMLIAVFLVSGLSMAWAQQEQQQPFDAKELSKFLGDWPKFKDWAVKQGQDAGVDALQAMQFNHSVMNFVKKLGWKPERFFYVMGNVAAGFGALQSKAASSQASEQIKAQREMIMNNPNMTDEQKKQILASMDQSQQAMAQAQNMSANIPKSEMNLIKAKSEAIKKVFMAD